MKNRLSAHGYHDTVKRINDAQMILGTPGEMYLEVMNELLRIKKEPGTGYPLIEDDVNELLAYGRSLNYFDPSEE